MIVFKPSTKVCCLALSGSVQCVGGVQSEEINRTYKYSVQPPLFSVQKKKRKKHGKVSDIAIEYQEIHEMSQSFFEYTHITVKTAGTFLVPRIVLTCGLKFVPHAIPWHLDT